MSMTNKLMQSLLYMVLTSILMVTAQAEVLVTYYHNDLLGSPVAATDQNGNVLWQEEYQPYGERIENDTASQLNRQWYTGKQLDQDTGLTYLGARYYDQKIGRFMGMDPVDFVESNQHSFNRYAYGNNNPYKYVDPNGEAAVPVVIGTGIFLLVAAIESQRDPEGKRRVLERINESFSGLFNEASDEGGGDKGGDGENGEASGENSSNLGPNGGKRGAADQERKDKQKRLRDKRREEKSRASDGQNPSTKKNKGPKGQRPKGPNRTSNRERNVGAGGEEHSRTAKGSGINIK